MAETMDDIEKRAFATPEERDAFVLAMRGAMAASHELLKFLDGILGGEPHCPLGAIQKAAAEARNAEAAWTLFARLVDEKTKSEGVRLN